MPGIKNDPGQYPSNLNVQVDSTDVREDIRFCVFTSS